MSEHLIPFTLAGTPLPIAIDRLIVAGWVGKDQAALQKHIDELAELGISPPGRTPTYMNLSPDILTCAPRIGCVGEDSSGEVECLVVVDREGQRYLGVGSDHTDRAFEKFSIPASKQMCAKPVADELWLFQDIASHLDEIVLRSWMIVDGQKALYQEGCLGDNRAVTELLQNIPPGTVADGESFCLFCGTFAAIGGLKYGERFEFEMCDPVLNRRITHGYDVEVLSQYL